MIPVLPLAGALAGAIVGSFIATLCIRWPSGEQAIVGRSRCDSCGRALSPLELLPIVSAIASWGRCRTCKAPIARLHLAIEVLAAVLVAIALVLQPNLQGAALAAFWLLLLAPAILDARHYWLPDTLTALLALAGLVLGGIATSIGLADRLIGAACGFAVLWLLSAGYRRLRGHDGLGAGDPKLLGAIGLWTGWVALPPMLLIASLGGLSVAVVQSRRASDRMPFGTLLAVAAILWSAATAYPLGG